MKEYVHVWFDANFRKTEFVEMLNKMNVSAMVCNDGIILDRAAFNAISVAHLPHWAFMNRKYINGINGVRTASDEEIALLNI